MKHLHFYLAATLLCGLLLTAMTGCTGEKYRVEYDSKGLYTNARDYYRAGTKVKLYFEMIATDTDYSFTLNGEYLPYTYNEKKGFVIEFVMPDHDVTLKCNSRNSIVYQPD